MGEQALGTATRKVENGIRLFGRFSWVTDNRNHLVVLNVEQAARSAFRQITWHWTIEEMDDLRFDCWRTDCGRRMGAGFLNQANGFGRLMGQALGFEAETHHPGTH